jgi:acid phosphatase
VVLALAAVASLVIGARQARADSSTLPAAADSYVYSGATGANYGADIAFKQSASTYRGLITFDTSGIPAGATVNSVSLRLYYLSSPGSGGTTVRPEPSSWIERSVTWATQPAWSSTVLATSATPSANGWTTIALPASAISRGGLSSFGLSYTTAGIIVSIASRESANAPQLLVDYTTGSSVSPPSAITGGSSSVTSSGATVSGTANANGAAATCSFAYGTTTSYGSSSPDQSIAAGTGSAPLSATLSGLAASTTYHYRLRCSNSAGSTDGANATFTTSAVPVTRKISKILTIIEENHGFASMWSGMPYLKSLALQYGYADHYHAVVHPSLPNYLAMAAGSTFGVTANCTVRSCPQSGPTVFDQAIAAGRTAKVYAEDMTSNCLTSGAGAGLYAVRHTAWPYFTDATSRANCNANQVPSGTYLAGNFKNDVAAGTLPAIGWLIPNLCNDAHNAGCSLARADSWLQRMLSAVFAGPDWQSGTLAIVVTADEADSSTSDNAVLTVVIHPDLNGSVVTTPLNHYSLTKLQEQVAGVTPSLNNAAGAPDMAAAFGLTVGP